MIQALLGKKLEQTQKFLESGRRVPVTVIAVSDNIVLQSKNEQKDNYTAVQLGYGSKKSGSKALVGHVKKAGLEKAPLRIKEVRVHGVATEDLPKAGDAVTVDSVFKAGDIVDVTGTSKGKGFAGVVKRHNFRGGPKTHGQSDRHRAPGSIGQTTTPGRVYKGKRMAGHMGAETVTVTNLTVVDVDAVNKKLYILGLVPGHKDAMLLVTQRGEAKKFVPLLNPVSADTAPVENEAEAPEAAVAASVQEDSGEPKEEQQVEVSEEAREAVEAVATPELVESVEEKAEEDAAEADAESNAVEGETSEDATSDVADSEGESKKEEDGK